MSLLGTLLKNRRSGDAESAWLRPNLQGAQTLTVSSRHFADGAPMPAEHAGRRVGGKNLSPQLAWSLPPEGTTHLLLVVEDIDVPISTPAVHCLAVLDPARLTTEHEVAAGALVRRAEATGVRVLRSTVGRGYHGPEPIKGHGPHRYVFQLFALGADPGVARARPRAVLASLTASVLARGRLTGTYER